MSSSPITRYPGQHADVTWDERLCIHIGECGRAKGDLFVAKRQPWCQPDLVPVADVVDVIERCPSGALAYDVKDGATRERPVPRNTIEVSYNGPLFARGELAIEGAAADMPGVRFRAALCRCGLSKNKPFCDNSHETAGFKDYGAVGERGDGLEGRGRHAGDQSGQGRAVTREGQLDGDGGHGATAVAGGRDVVVPLRSVEEQAVLRRQPQTHRLPGRLRRRGWRMKSR